MKRSIRRLMVIAGASSLAGTLALANAHPGLEEGPRAGREAAQAYRVALARVGLSLEQKGSIRSIVAAERPSIEALKGRRQSSRAALDAALQAPDPDPTVVGNALIRVRADRQALRAEMKKLRDRTGSVLTPEQKAKLDGYLDGVRASRRRTSR